MTVSLIVCGTIVYAMLMGHNIEERMSKWAANLFKALLFISMGFLCTFCLNALSEITEMDRDTYLSNYTSCGISAFLGCLYLLPVMMGDGKKQKNKISKDAFK